MLYLELKAFSMHNDKLIFREEIWAKSLLELNTKFILAEARMDEAIKQNNESFNLPDDIPF